MPYEIRATARFVKDVRKLKHKYRRIGEDLRTLQRQLQDNPTSGDRIPGVDGPVFKIRLQSQDMQRGKQGGYRVVYYLRVQPDMIYLLTIYAKARQEDIRPEEINQILKTFGSS